MRTDPIASVFRGKRALVVGGSGGIGAALSEDLARRGSSLLIHGRDRIKVESLSLSLAGRFGAETGFLAADIASPSAFAKLLEPYGHFDIVAVSFGPFLRKSLADTDPEDWERMALLDLALPGALAGLYFEGMLEREFGRFLFLGGTRTDAIRAYRTTAAYSAAKTGLGVLAKSLAAEGSGKNVAALVACPGFVDTEYLGEASRREAASRAPGGHLLDPAALARSILDLLDTEPCAASGAVINLDAGFSPSV
ncbi:MAG TPA: SDR family oxidoreductase [Rectinemataceae bacterium]